MQDTYPQWLQQISKWWVLIVLGAIVLLAGLATVNYTAMVIGAVLVLVGGCADRFDLIDFNISEGRVLLKRQTVEEALFRLAIAQGVPPQEARSYAAAMAAEFPEQGAPVTVSDSGDAEAALSDSASIVFRVPPGKKLTEEDLAEELAESQAENLKRSAETGDGLEALSESFGDLRDVHTSEAKAKDADSPPPPAPALPVGLEAKLDPDKHSLIYPTGGYSLRKHEIKPGSRVMIGRGEGNDLSLIGPRVSRTHALITCPLEGPAVINNLASTHGVYVNGRRVEGEQLHDGDAIGIGDYTLYYSPPRGGSAPS